MIKIVMPERKFFYRFLEDGLEPTWTKISDKKNSKDGDDSEKFDESKFAESSCERERRIVEDDERDMEGGDLYYSSLRITLPAPLNYLYFEINGGGRTFGLAASIVGRDKKSFDGISKMFDKQVIENSESSEYFYPTSNSGLGHIIRVRKHPVLRSDPIASIAELDSEHGSARMLSLGGCGSTPLVFGGWSDFVSDSNRFLGYLNSYLFSTYKTRLAPEEFAKIPDIEFHISP